MNYIKTTNEETNQEATKRGRPKKEPTQGDEMTKKLKHLEASAKHYQKKILTNPDARAIFTERAKRYRLKKNNGEIKAKGRPRKTPQEEPIKKILGRPRKYFLIPPFLTLDETPKA